MIFYVIDFAIILILISQLVLPLFLGKPMFPFFREKNKYAELGELKQQLSEQEIEDQIKELKQQLQKDI